jgi:hypothetical protein
MKELDDTNGYSFKLLRFQDGLSEMDVLDNLSCQDLREATGLGYVPPIITVERSILRSLK